MVGGDGTPAGTGFFVTATVPRPVQRTHLVRLGIGSLLIAAAGFAVSGLSRLVVSTDTALALGAPLLLIGFFLAIVTFVLAALLTAGVLEIEERAEAPEEPP